jgi:glutamate racemase
MKIAFFDSGVGGLTVLHEALKRMPGEDYIYYGDSDHAPYGTKTKGEIKEHVFRSVDFSGKTKFESTCSRLQYGHQRGRRRP